MRPFAVPIAFVALLALVPAAPAAAQTQPAAPAAPAAPAPEAARSWVFDDNPEAPVLTYGTPESDDVVIAMSCEPADKMMRITEFVGSDQLKPGTKATLKLTAGTASLALTGDAIANEMDGTVNVEVAGPPNPRLFALLKAGPQLVIEIHGSKETVPLAGATPHVATFEKLCAGKK